MSIDSTTRERASADDPSGDEGAPAPTTDRDGFLRWGIAAHVTAVTLITAAVVIWLGGTLVYVQDDAAIHLSVADRLVHDGTWGVVPGRFESASSSPLWTLLVAAGTAATGPLSAWVPLLLNAAAGVGVVAVLAAGQSVLRPSRTRRLDAAATVVLVVGVLFLPGLAIVGMEHSLHMVLVLIAVLGVHRWALDRPGWPVALTFGAVALGSLARFETAFVALGLAAALAVDGHRRDRRRALAVLVASALPIVAFGVFNRLMGGGWLPNSVIAKGQGPGQMQNDPLTPLAIVDRAAEDPLVVILLTVAAVYLVLRGRRAPAAVPAVTLLVAGAVHVTLADIGWYHRYQAYLIAIGVYLVLALLAEVPEPLHRRAVAAVCVVALAAGIPKTWALVRAPAGADDMYRQQYAAGRFLDRFYDRQPVATDQLGYISLFHDGPLTDFAGLGDYDVLQRRTAKSAERQVAWAELQEARGFRVVVLYDVSAFLAPREWVRVGSWRIDTDTATGVSRTLVFLATETDEIEPLQDHLREFEDEMPARSALTIDEGAALRGWSLDADARHDGPDDGDGAAGGALDVGDRLVPDVPASEPTGLSSD